LRGADTLIESLFTMRKLENFVPARHPLREIRKSANAALDKPGTTLTAMYAADINGGRPSIAPEKLLRALRLQVLFSARSERQLMEQVQYNLLFRWLIGLSVDDAVWVPTVFTKNRERLIKHDAVIKFFNDVVAIAQQRDLLSGEHFSVDGTLTRAWAGQKSFTPKDDEAVKSDGDGTVAGDFKGQRRNNDTHESKTDGDARLYRKGDTDIELRCMGRTHSDNRHGLIANAMVTRADGYVEHEAAESMINDAREIPVGADIGCDAKEFIDACQALKANAHVAQSKSKRKSDMPEEVAQIEGYAASQRERKLIEQGFGWVRTVGSMSQVMVRGLERVDQMFVLFMAVYNLVRMRSLGIVRLQAAQ
jgi:transposase